MAVTLTYSIFAIVGLAVFGAKGIAGGLVVAFLFIIFSGITTGIVNGGALPKEWRRKTSQAFISANRRTIAATYPETTDAAVLSAVEAHIEAILAELMRKSGELDLETAATSSAIHEATLAVAGRTKSPRLNLLFAELSLHLKGALHQPEHRSTV